MLSICVNVKTGNDIIARVFAYESQFERCQRHYERRRLLECVIDVEDLLRMPIKF